MTAPPPLHARLIGRILKVWTALETVAIGCMIFAALAVFLWGAAVRALAPARAVDWAEEVALYFIIWATMLSGSVLAAEGRHINTEVFTSGLPAGVQRWLRRGLTLVMLGFCAAMLHFGLQAYHFAILLDERSGSSLRTPQSWAVFLALPVGMGLIIGRMVLLILAGQDALGGETAQRRAAGD